MLGNTGLEISEIGLGCEGFVGKDEHETEELLNLAQKKGINYLDLYTPDSDLRDRIGEKSFSFRGISVRFGGTDNISAPDRLMKSGKDSKICFKDYVPILWK